MTQAQDKGLFVIWQHITKDRLLESKKRVIQLHRYQDEQKEDFWIAGVRKEEQRVEEHEKG